MKYPRNGVYGLGFDDILSQGLPLRAAIGGGSHALRDSYGGAGSVKATASTIGIVQWFQAFAGMGVEIVTFSGEGGRGIQEVLDKLDTEVLAFYPDIFFLFMDCTGNTLAANNGQEMVVSSAQDALDVLKKILEKCYARNILVVVYTLPPNANCLAAAFNGGQFDGSVNLTTSKETQRFNHILRGHSRDDKRFVLVAADDYLVDVDAAGGRYITNQGTGGATAAWTHDFTHYHPRAAITVGLRTEEVLAKRFATRTLQLPASNSHKLTRLLNPTNSGATAATAPATGSIGLSNTLTATGLTSGTVVASKKRRRDFGDNGEAVKVVVTNAAGLASAVYTFAGNSAISDIPAGQALYAVVWAMLLAQPSFLRGLSPTLNYAGVSQPHVGFNPTASGSSADLADVGPWLPVGRWIAFHTPIASLPVGATNFNVTLTATKSAGGNLSAQYLIGGADIFFASSVPPIHTPLVLP